jgi:hypothetical protein
MCSESCGLLEGGVGAAGLGSWMASSSAGSSAPSRELEVIKSPSADGSSDFTAVFSESVVFDDSSVSLGGSCSEVLDKSSFGFSSGPSLRPTAGPSVVLCGSVVLGDPGLFSEGFSSFFPEGALVLF